MIPYEEALERAKAANAMLYNRKQTRPYKERDAELAFLYSLATDAPDGPAVECGVYHGGSLLCWSCARIGRGPIIAVDNWSSKNHEIFTANVARYSLDVQVLSMECRHAPKAIKGDVAFCFIDSDHFITGIPFDILAWPDKIMPGGFLVFHDYGVRKPTVAVKCIVDCWQANAQWQPLGRVGSTIAFQKPVVTVSDDMDDIQGIEG